MPTINLPLGGGSGTSAADNIYGSSGNDIIDGGDGNDNVRGGDGSDTLYGGAGDDQLDAGSIAPGVGDGDEDFMYGGLDNDTYNVYEAGDHVFENAGEGIDTVKAWISYTLTENVEVLRLQGTANLSGKGNALDNTLVGNSGNNNLSGLAGNDRINGGDGDDIINGGSGDDILTGGAGTDLLTYKVGATGGVTVSLAKTSWQDVGGGHDRDLISGFENLEGTQFADNLTGNNDANKIAGLDGGDIIRGMGGNDDITGGLGGDTFVFESIAENGVDRIRQFETGVDKLEFHATDGYNIEGFSISGTKLYYGLDQLAEFDNGKVASLSDIIIT